jgi:hypothetical protein
MNAISMFSRFLLRASALFLLALAVLSCSGTSDKPTEEAQAVDREAFTASADSISGLAQNALLQSVSGAIAAGGSLHAIEFCNVQAIPITDSVAAKHGFKIQRVTDRTRNKANALSGEKEIALFETIQENLQAGKMRENYLIESESGAITYYKPIVLAMPTCLQCHGQPESDIESATLRKIKEKYPDDAATGYSLGQLRGMWKVSL